MNLFLFVFFPITVCVFFFSIWVVKKAEKKYKPVVFIENSGYFGTLKEYHEKIVALGEKGKLMNIKLYSSDVSRFYNYSEFWKWLKLDHLTDVDIEIILRVLPTCELYQKAVKKIIDNDKKLEKSEEINPQKLIKKINRVYHSSSPYVVKPINKWADGLLVQFCFEGNKQVLFITDSFKYPITEGMKDVDIIKLCEDSTIKMNESSASIYTSSSNAYLCSIADEFLDEAKKQSKEIDKGSIFA